jgi:hypothetical protein
LDATCSVYSGRKYYEESTHESCPSK